jgi:hypothetical protein
MHDEISQIYEKFNTASSSQEYQELDQQLRDLNDRIMWENEHIDDLHRFIDNLNEQDW